MYTNKSTFNKVQISLKEIRKFFCFAKILQRKSAYITANRAHLY